MQKKLKLKPFVVPTIYALSAIVITLSVLLMTNTLKENKTRDPIYVSGSILESEIPVVSLEQVVVRPYADKEVALVRHFYKNDDEESKQQQSLKYYENMYMQNSGSDYTKKEVFDVVSILDGVVMEVKDTELMGKMIQIRHDNELISVYQSLSEVTVKKDDKVSIGQVIGKSGTSEVDKELNNYLHFELYNKGQVVDPEACYDKKISDLR